jgi:hypothetical protein
MHMKTLALSGPSRLGFTPGNMGATGNAATDVHLHFSVQRDSNGNGVYDNMSVDKVVDPYGWLGTSLDPWVVSGGPASNYL